MIPPILIHTCDAYAFCWPYLFRGVRDHLKGRTIYFANEEVDIDQPNMIQLKTGPGEWSDRLRIALERLDDDVIFYMQEDRIPVCSLPFARYYRDFVKHDMDCLRTCRGIKHYTFWDEEFIGVYWRLWPTSAYLVDHYPGFWRREYLLSCLEPGETPWQNEIRGSKRLKGTDCRIFLVRHPWFAHIVRRGEHPRGQGGILGGDQMNERDIYNMKLHDVFLIGGVDVQVHRVPGGWNYIYQFDGGVAATFVPFDPEFQRKVVPDDSRKAE